MIGDAFDLTVVGLGYIGLPTAALFAASGMRVRGVDVAPAVVDAVNRGAPHIVEPGLDKIVATATSSGGLVASTELQPSDVFVIAVPTPFRGDHEPDLSAVEAAAASIAPHLRPNDLVVLESTSPVGATESLARWISDRRPDLGLGADHGIAIAYCPERVLPGNIMHELVHNDRLIGGLTPSCAERAAEFYRRVVKGECRNTTARTAELAKLTENAFRDVNIAFANELSLVAHDVDVDVWELIELANLHPRVNILRPGPGVGGHCIAVDPWFIAHASENTPLIRTARGVNDAKPAWVVDRVLEAIAAIEEPVVACLGLSYKPDIDDLRESPAIEVVRLLSELERMRVIAVEPNIGALPAPLVNRAVDFASLDHALAEADVVVGLVPHAEVLQIPAERLEGKILVDPAGIFATRDPLP
ncbi:MAG: UDP-N-acetyl-D-mannosamine dehydrogenase [Actinomycetota bacterium]